MQKPLTNKTLEALKPQTKRYEVHDLHCPGMSVRVSARGQKILSVKFRYGVDQKRMKLGVFPRIALATAREKAMDILRQGIDPTKRRRSPDMKVEAVCGARNESWREAERILEREFVGTFGQRDIREVKRYDVLEIMDAAVARGSTYQANRILSNIRKLFNWRVERGIVETSPITGLKAPTKEETRERVNDARPRTAARSYITEFR
jgi:hypothetical protein